MYKMDNPSKYPVWSFDYDNVNNYEEVGDNNFQIFDDGDPTR